MGAPEGVGGGGREGISSRLLRYSSLRQCYFEMNTIKEPYISILSFYNSVIDNKIGIFVYPSILVDLFQDNHFNTLWELNFRSGGLEISTTLKIKFVLEFTAPNATFKLFNFKIN